MAAIDDLQAADAAETAEIATVGQALTDEITRVNAALATLGNSTDPPHLTSWPWGGNVCSRIHSWTSP